MHQNQASNKETERGTQDYAQEAIYTDPAITFDNGNVTKEDQSHIQTEHARTA